jgi:hypothetical protein
LAAGAAVREAVGGGGDAPGWVEVLGRGGLVAYGALHGLIAALVVRAIVGAQQYIAIDQLSMTSFGLAGLVVIAAGIAAFGVYCLIDAYARHA